MQQVGTNECVGSIEIAPGGRMMKSIEPPRAGGHGSLPRRSWPEPPPDRPTLKDRITPVGLLYCRKRTEHAVYVLIFGEMQMTVSQFARNITGVVALLTLTAVANAVSAGEKPVNTVGAQRTHLSFKVSNAAVQKLLPEGWEASPNDTGPSKDANLTVVFVDLLTVQNPDGSPGETFRVAGLAIPAKKKGTDATIPMVVGGFASSPSYVPGPYNAFALASAALDRHVHTDPAGKSNIEESWDFKADDGNAIQLQLQYVGGIATRSKSEALPHSAIKPGFYRIYRIDQAQMSCEAPPLVPTVCKNMHSKRLAQSWLRFSMARNN